MTKKLPKSEWIKLDNAAGTATKGLVKFSRAKTTPKPEFCIPTSIEMVLATFQFLNTPQLMIKPIKNPKKWSKNKPRNIEMKSNLSNTLIIP